MCGLAGWFGPSPSSADLELRAMGAAIAHRGPDGEGYWRNGSAGFAHRRLAIIDLDSGAQPLSSHDGRFVIIFNGEIYNYRDLKSDLDRRGHRFVTQSDTEVVVELFRAEGVAGFQRLRGMYAFALWDAAEQRGVLARDPSGIKPMFVRRQGDRLLFGSEAKALIAVTGPAPLDHASLHLLLNFRYLPGRRTLFKGVEQLDPGEVFLWHEGHVARHQIDLPKPSDEPLLQLLERSVQRHLVADVEVGSYLSGGIDSGLIVALAARETSGRLRTFTLPIGDDPAEARNAADTARTLGVENIQGQLDAGGESERLVWHLETPKVNAWQVRALASNVRRHVKVVMSGLGADELFYGYNAHRILDVIERWKRHAATPARIIGALLAQASARFGPPWSEPHRLGLMLEHADWPRTYGLLRNLWDRPEMRTWIYGPRMRDHDLPDAFAELAGLWPQDPDPVRAAAGFEWRHKMVNDLLWQEDRASMAVGLEVRVPYLDADLAETVRSLPRSRLMPHGQRKGLLRNLAKDFLPAQVLRRRKSGFQLDAPAFVSGHLRGQVESWLSEERLARHGLFNPVFVHDVVRKPPKRALRWHWFMIYLMMQTHMWIETFEQGARAAPVRG